MIYLYSLTQVILLLTIDNRTRQPNLFLHSLFIRVYHEFLSVPVATLSINIAFRDNFFVSSILHINFLPHRNPSDLRIIKLMILFNSALLMLLCAYVIWVLLFFSYIGKNYVLQFVIEDYNLSCVNYSASILIIIMQSSALLLVLKFLLSYNSYDHCKI